MVSKNFTPQPNPTFFSSLLASGDRQVQTYKMVKQVAVGVNVCGAGLDSVHVNFCSTNRRRSHVRPSTTEKIQACLNELLKRLGLPKLNCTDVTETGGFFSTDNDAVAKCWFCFWEGQPAFWLNPKKANGRNCSKGTLERCVPSIKNELTKKFVLSRCRKVIEENCASAFSSMKATVKEQKKASPSS